MSKGKLLNGVRIIGLVTKASTAEIFHPQSVSLNSDGSLQDPLPPVDTVAAWHLLRIAMPTRARYPPTQDRKGKSEMSFIQHDVQPVTATQTCQFGATRTQAALPRYIT